MKSLWMTFLDRCEKRLFPKRYERGMRAIWADLLEGIRREQHEDTERRRNRRHLQKFGVEDPWRT